VNQEESPTAPQPSQVVVMTGAAGQWGVSVDQVVALETLEVVINVDDHHDGSSVVMGSANYRDQVVRVLNHTSLIRRAQLVLKKYWEDRRTILCG
jgi:hypothetical protein